MAESYTTEQLARVIRWLSEQTRGYMVEDVQECIAWAKEYLAALNDGQDA